MASQTARLTEGSVGRHLVAMSVPVLFGIFTMMLQSFIDMWFIGQLAIAVIAKWKAVVRTRLPSKLFDASFGFYEIAP